MTSETVAIMIIETGKHFFSNSEQALTKDQPNELLTGQEACLLIELIKNDHVLM
jgi:hypothetical protein